MKIKILLLTLVIMYALPIVFGAYCYQESMTVNNQTGIDGNCGLNYSGNYYYAQHNLYINYSKPNFLLNNSDTIPKIIWQVKHGNLASYNVSIPSSCFNYYTDKISLNLFSNIDVDKVLEGYSSYGQCYNGVWINITNIVNFVSSLGYSAPPTHKAIDGNWATWEAGEVAGYNPPAELTNGWINEDNGAGGVTGGSLVEEAIYWNTVNVTINITTKNSKTLSTISSTSGILTNSTYSLIYGNLTTTGNLLFYKYSSDYDLTISATNYSSTTVRLNLSNFTGTYNYTVYLNPQNELYTTFKDEESLAVLPNVSYTLISDNFSLTGTTTNGYANFTNLANGNYEIRYNKTNYVPRSYYITIPNLNSDLTNLTLYALSNSSAFIFTLYTTDKYEIPQHDLKVSLLRRYPINGQTVYYVVEQMKPAYALGGQATFSAVPNNVAYLFRVEDSSGTVVFQGSGLTASNFETLYLISNPIYIRATLDSNPFINSQALEGISYSLTNSTDTFWLSVSDSANVVSQICLKIMVNTTISVYDYCTTNKQTILSYITTNPNNSSYYTAFGYVTTSSGNRILDVKTIDYRVNDASKIYGNFGLLLALISVITISVAFADKPMFMVIGIAISLLALGSQALNIIWLSATLQATILILAIIVAYIMRDN